MPAVNAQIITMIFIGLAAGALSGLTGIGGGIIMVPAMIYLLGYSMHLAQGTSLAIMVPPLGLLAAWAYYQKGFVDVRSAAIIAVCFILGTVIGSRLALNLSDIALRRIFAVMLIVVAGRMLLQKS